MKINHIVTEDTYENVSIIDDIVEYIIDVMPDSIPENSTYRFGYNARGGNSGNDWLKDTSSPEIKSIKELLKENEKNSKIKTVLDYLIYNTIIFHNTEAYVNHNAAGDYSWGPINIYVSTIQRSTREFIIKYTEEKGVYPSFKFQNLKFFKFQKLKSVLAHELRHAFQDVTYNTYMRSPTRDIDKKTQTRKDWSERQIEWDAKWTDIIYEFTPKDYSDVDNYLGDVMSEYLQWVKLPPKVKQHYKRKTAAYYINWYRKELEKVWMKTIDSYRKYIEDGSFTRDQIIEYILEELTWHINNTTGELPKSVKSYYKIKTAKYYEEAAQPLKKKAKIKSYIEKYNEEYKQNIQSFFDANYDRLSEINTYAAASGIVNRLMDNHPDFFYTKNKKQYEISHEVNKYFYREATETIKNIKEIVSKKGSK